VVARNLTRRAPSTAHAAVRIGMGGWVYGDWRNHFYPPGWPRSRELEYASQRLGAIEINSTFYGNQKPATFATVSYTHLRAHETM
jgi:uncharacterized protein YecE (DUF72 family)